MAINAMIPLAGRGVQLPDFASDRLRITQNRALQQDMDQQAFKMRQEQETMNALRSLGMNPTQEQVQNVFAVNPQAGLAAQNMLFKQQQMGLERTKAETEAKEAQAKLEASAFDLQSKKLGRLANRISSAKDDFTLQLAIDGAIQDGDIPADIGGQLRNSRFSDPQTQAVLKQFMDQVTSAQQKLDAEYKANQEARSAAEAERKAQADAARLPGIAAESQYAQMRVQGLTPEQKNEAARLNLSEKQYREQVLHNRNTESITMRGQNMVDARARQSLVEGAKLEAGAVQRLTELQDGLAQIGELRNIVQKNGAVIGPVIGQATKPILNETLQFFGVTQPAEVKARIDLVRQVIGKALEGGVLRKEDEAKYKAILPTMTDSVDVALSKINALEKKLNTDIDTFLKTQGAAGRRVPNVERVAPNAPAPSGPVRMIAPNGQIKEVDPEDIALFESNGAKRIR